MAILTGTEIRARVATEDIFVTPYDASKVQPNSIDLTLGTGVCVYSSVVYDTHAEEKRFRPQEWTGRSINSYRQSQKLNLFFEQELDVKKDNPIRRFDLDESGWLLQPGILYLMHVVEVLYAPNLVMTLDGKSSLARLGITIHFTAGHAETGFRGQYTMEVNALHPVRVYPGMDIAQVIFDTVEGEVEDYKTRGNYVGEAALGAQPSRSWRQFK